MLDDKLQALLLLSSFTKSWETLVVSLSNYTLDEELTLSQMKENMFNEEARREDIGSSVSKALLMENRGISKSRE